MRDIRAPLGDGVRYSLSDTTSGWNLGTRQASSKHALAKLDTTRRIRVGHKPKVTYLRRLLTRPLEHGVRALRSFSRGKNTSFTPFYQITPPHALQSAAVSRRKKSDDRGYPGVLSVLVEFLGGLGQVGAPSSGQREKENKNVGSRRIRDVVDANNDFAQGLAAS